MTIIQAGGMPPTVLPSEEEALVGGAITLVEME